MSGPLFALYGTAGCARDALPHARERVTTEGHEADRLVLIDDAPSTPTVNGHAVMTYEQFLAADAEACHLAIAINDSAVRERLTVRTEADGVQAWSMISPSALVLDDVTLGHGALISAFVTFTANIVVGRSFHANNYCNIAHDCRIGDFVTFAPGVRCNGNVHIGDHAYVGAGATIRQGTPDKPRKIGAGAVIGMGAVVLEDVPDGVTVAGNPARPIRGAS